MLYLAGEQRLSLINTAAYQEQRRTEEWHCCVVQSCVGQCCINTASLKQIFGCLDSGNVAFYDRGARTHTLILKLESRSERRRIACRLVLPFVSPRSSRSANWSRMRYDLSNLFMETDGQPRPALACDDIA